MGTECMMHESIWFDRHGYDEAEELNQMYLNGLPLPVTHDHGHHGHHGHHDHGKHHGKTQHHEHHGKDHHDHHGKNQHHDHHGKNQHHDHHGKNQHHDHHGKNQHHGKHGKGASTSVMEIAEARRKIHETLTGAPHSASSHGVSEKRIEQLEAENKDLRKQSNDLAEALKKLELRVAQLESSKSTTAPAPTPAKEQKKEEKKEESDDDDLFGSDSEDDDEEQERIKKERLEAYYAKKSKKPQVIAKSSITIDVKPWDDETDVNEMEKKVRSVATDGLIWGASKIVPIAYGIQKLQISCVVEDDKVGTDYLEEHITAFEDFVQSVDVVAFNKL